MPKRNKTNLERLSDFVSRHGAKSLLIYTVPGTSLWLVAQVKKPGWKISVCYPNQTKMRLVSEHISDQDHLILWQELIGLGVSNRLKTAQVEFRKQISNFYSNKHKKQPKI